MSVGGPTPTPSKVLRNRGSWRANLRKHEPDPGKGIPARPSDMTEAELAVWDAFCAATLSMGVLTPLDGPQIRRYASYAVRWIEAERTIREKGAFYESEGRNGRFWKSHPALQESRNLDKAMKEIEAAFGLTPSARTRLSINTNPTDPAEVKLAAFKLPKGGPQQ